MKEVPFRGGGYTTRPRRWVGLAVMAGLLALWWLGSTRGWISPIALPPPEAVVKAFRDLFVTGKIWDHLGASLYRLGMGWFFGSLAGIAVGLAMGLSRSVRGGAGPLVAALFPVPKIALLPLFIVWFGIGEASKYATIAFGVFSPMAIAAFGGVDGVDRGLIRMAQSFGVPTADIVRKIVLPGAAPALLSGARISASIGIILLTAAEMIGAEHGVGALVLAAGNLMQIDRLIAGVLVLSGLGLTVAQLIGWAERRLLRWR